MRQYCFGVDLTSTSEQYDNLNRVTLKDLVVGETDVTYSYDTAPPGFSGQTGYWVGRLAKVVDTSGTHEFKYDKQGRIVSDKKTVSGTGYQFDKSFDSMGPRESRATEDVSSRWACRSCAPLRTTAARSTSPAGAWPTLVRCAMPSSLPSSWRDADSL